MRILIITQYFWPETFRINELAEGLITLGHEVTVLTGLPNYPAGKLYSGYRLMKPLRETYRGVEIIRVPVVTRGRAKFWRIALNYFSYVISACLMGLPRCRGHYDAMLVYAPSPITQALPAMLRRKRFGTPLLLYVQDLWPESVVAVGAVKKSAFLRGITRLVRAIYRSSDCILVQSAGMIPKVQEHITGDKKIVHLPNAAEDIYKPLLNTADFPERAQFPEGFNIVFAGNIGFAQDFPNLLAAAELLKTHPQIHFIILGDGNQREWLLQEIKKRSLGNTVHYLGSYPRDQMPRYFALADALLVSLRDEPIFACTVPSKLQSYLACGKPVIAALRGDGAQLVFDAKAGLVANPESPESLADAVLKMQQLSQLERGAMGLRGRDYFEKHFSHPVILERLEKILQETAQTSG